MVKDFKKGIKAKLPRLHFLGIFLNGISFVMGFGAIIFLFIDLLPAIKVIIMRIEMLKYFYFSERVLHTCVICFCGFMSEKPTSWLIRLAKNPEEFFRNECKFVHRYRPVIWSCFWTSLFLWLAFSLNSLEAKHSTLIPPPEPGVSAYFLILIPSYLVSILSIALIEYYRKWMMVHK